MAMVTSGAGNDIIDPVVQLISGVIHHEDSHHILQIELGRMEMLLQDIGLFQYQLKAPAPENVKIWFQLLHNCVAEAKPLLHRSGSRQRGLDSVTRNPRRLSKQVSQWKALFNHVFQGFETELFHHIVLSRNAINNHVVGPIIPLLKDVINKEDERQILHADFRRMESLLQDMSTLFPDITRLFQPQQKAPLLTSLQLLQTCLVMARRLLDRPEPRRNGCLDSVVHNSRKQISKEIREWNAFYDEVYHAFQSYMSMLVTSLQFLSTKPLYKEDALLQVVAASGFVGSGIMDAQAQVERWLNQGDRPHLIGVYGMPGLGKTSLLQMIYDKYKNVFDRQIWVTIPEDYTMSDLQRAIQEGEEGNEEGDEEEESEEGEEGDEEEESEEGEEEEAGERARKRKLSAYLKEKKFLLVLDGLWSRIDLQELGVAFGEGKHSKVLFSTRSRELIGEMGAEESIEMQPLSRDEAWMLFRRVAFKDDQVPVDIQERAVRFAEECKGVPLGINIVAAMIGQTSVDDWDACFSLKNNVDPSFPATHPRLDAQLYTLLRWGYDALPNSDVKNCFLYCAMYKEDEVIDSRQLVEMWIGEGLVKSKEGTHLMDMAIGRNYLKLLIDRCFFQIVKQSNKVSRPEFSKDVSDVFPSIRVHHGLIHDMAVYIAEKEENFLLMGSQNLRNFPEAVYENCTRMSMTIRDLPTNLRCPKLATLILKGNKDLKELPSEFLLSLTSLRVLNLSGCTNITTSLPTEVGQLTLLQFLSLSDLPIQDLPQEIGHLSNLQFLDLSGCRGLNSLPSQIGQLRNLKHLNLLSCRSLKMIPREMSELTSLSRLLLCSHTTLSVEMEARASIWTLKGLRSLTELDVLIDTKQQDGKRSRINDGIMGTWSEMRHLALNCGYDDNESDEEDLLPEDMHNMKKLQSFMLCNYRGLSLPNFKFEHLEMVYLSDCKGIKALSPLEQMPNLKLLKLGSCHNLRELGIGSPSGYVSLQKLVFKCLSNLESLDGGASQRGVWDERTLSQLRVLKMVECPSLRRFPRGMETLPNLCALIYQPWDSSCKSAMEWSESITWEDDNSKVKLQQTFIARDPKY